MSRIALVHDYFVQMGGAERVAEAMHDSFPLAPMYTTVALPQSLPQRLRTADIRTSPLQRLPKIDSRFRHYFMLYPFAVENFDLSQYDLIFSSSSGYAKGVRRRRNAIHVCYCHTPMRWVWRYEDYIAREGFGRVARSVLPFLLWGLRKWDLRASRQPNYYIANSRLVARRIKAIYGREAFVIPPPIEVNRFHMSDQIDDYYLVLSRLMPYKRIDLAIEACKRMNRRLIVIGDGPDRARLEKLGDDRIEFLGRQSDSVVNYYAARCRALIFPGEEDFGMAPLEANAAGRPVIAFRGGGAVETIEEGRPVSSSTKPRVTLCLRRLKSLRACSGTSTRCEDTLRNLIAASSRFAFCIPRIRRTRVVFRRAAGRSAAAFAEHFAPRLAAFGSGRLS